MTAPLHVVPLWAQRGDHKASRTCPCAPVPAADLADPHVAVYVHRFLPPVHPDVPRVERVADVVDR